MAEIGQILLIHINGQRVQQMNAMSRSILNRNTTKEEASEVQRQVRFTATREMRAADVVTNSCGCNFITDLLLVTKWGLRG